MARPKKNVSIATEGKPTEMTGVPQPPKTRHTPIDGIITGVPKGVQTKLADGIITGLHGRETGAMPKVAPSATKVALQEFGNVRFQMGAF
jgi:hypothetical protein